jgi:hypothetical protein
MASMKQASFAECVYRGKMSTLSTLLIANYLSVCTTMASFYSVHNQLLKCLSPHGAWDSFFDWFTTNMPRLRRLARSSMSYFTQSISLLTVDAFT